MGLQLLLEYSWQWVIQVKSLPHQMGHHGLQGLLEQQKLYMESPTETVPSWWWVKMDPSSPLLMEPLGLKEPLEHQSISMESPTETDSS